VVNNSAISFFRDIFINHVNSQVPVELSAFNPVKAKAFSLTLTHNEKGDMHLWLYGKGLDVNRGKTRELADQFLAHLKEHHQGEMWGILSMKSDKEFPTKTRIESEELAEVHDREALSKTPIALCGLHIVVFASKDPELGKDLQEFSEDLLALHSPALPLTLLVQSEGVAHRMHYHDSAVAGNLLAH